MQLLPILQQTFPNFAVNNNGGGGGGGFESIHTVIQANAEGHVVKIDLPCTGSSSDGDHQNGDDGNGDLSGPSTAPTRTSSTMLAFVKQVDVAQYCNKKSWPDLRRTLMYLRTEVRMYREVIPQLNHESSSSSSSTATASSAFPRMYDARYNLDGLLTEEEAATDPVGSEPTELLTSIVKNSNKSTSSDEIDDAVASNADGDTATSNAATAASWNEYGGYIVMEGISSDEYYQDSPISLAEAKETLGAVAALHSSAWEDEELLTMAQRRLSRGSYHLLTRNPKELQGMTQSWDHFKSQFGTIEFENGKYTPLFERCGDMGHRIQSLAEYICDRTSPTSSDLYATLSHGDFKSMNCFLPKQDDTTTTTPSSSSTSENNNNKTQRCVKIVDFASTGVGLGMSDVAMHIHHAVRPELLADGGEEMLLDHYLAVLNDLLLLRLRQNGHDETRNVPPYPRDVALQHYRLAVADYFRFFLGRFWKSATPEAFIKKKDSKNTALINRDVDAAMAFLERVEKYVTIIEGERATASATAMANET
mmetsp:Transcript_22307/g.52538  ORF Transcript_22307/g.52538 Transcript_22307/m.52538 type:complete len:535 (-) Transcript_22307:1351-2955(-)